MNLKAETDSRVSSCSRIMRPGDLGPGSSEKSESLTLE
jgi:hypothetical protein